MSEWNENVFSRRFGEKRSSDGVRAVDEVTDLWHPMASARPPLCYEERWWPQAQIQETTGEAASADVLSSGIVMKYVLLLPSTSRIGRALLNFSGHITQSEWA